MVVSFYFQLHFMSQWIQWKVKPSKKKYATTYSIVQSNKVRG